MIALGILPSRFHKLFMGRKINPVTTSDIPLIEYVEEIPI